MWKKSKWTQLLQVIAASGLALCVGTVLSGCPKDGPLENAGEEVDEAGEEIADEVDDHT